MNTPKTDAACGWPWGHHGRIECSDLRWSPDGPFVHSSVARELERENAALKACVDRTGEANDKLVVEKAGLRAELEAQAVVNGKGGEREAKLLAEVAALRKAKEMLEVERCECLRTMDLALNESAGLRGALEESQEYGRNHANAVMKLLSVISRIRFAVDSQPDRSQAMRLEDVGDLCDEVLGKKASP